MVETFKFLLAGFILDFFVLSLMVLFGIRLIYEAKNKIHEAAKQFNTGLGLFFLSIAASALIYGIDLASRQFFGSRIFPANQQYIDMGYEFDSFHIESYFIVVLIFILVAFGNLMHPIELHILQRKKSILSKICFILSPLPVILRILELIVLPQDGTAIHWIFTIAWILIWLMIVITVLTLLGAYFKIGLKSAGTVRNQSFAISISIIVWLGSILYRPNFLKGIANDPYLFWTLPLLEFIMFGLLIFGFQDNIELKSQDKEQYLYENWAFQMIMTASFIAVGAYFTFYYWNRDLEVIEYWRSGVGSGITEDFGKFMDQSLFEGGGFGGQDISYFIILPFVLMYLLSIIPSIKEKLKEKNLLSTSGFIVASSLGIAIFNRMFKALFGRTRPGHIGSVKDGIFQEYTPMWTFGAHSFSDGLSSGSFTSGHTSTAMIVVVLAFIVIRTHKTWLITLTFAATLTWAGIMGYGRVVHGAHYPGDTIWAILLGLLLYTWIYFKVLKIPQQERGEFEVYAKWGELRWIFCFLFFCVGILLVGLGIRFYILGRPSGEDFETYYWLIGMIIGPFISYLAKKRMDYLINGPKKKSVDIKSDNETEQ